MNAFDVTIVGSALEDKGFVGFNTIDPLGLLTFGFIWACPSIWSPGPEDNKAATVWTDFIYDQTAADLLC